MTHLKLAADKPSLCRWCLVLPVQTTIHDVGSCLSCADAGDKERVRRWLNAVQVRR